MTYLSEEEKCILRMYLGRDRVRTASNMISALKDTEDGPEVQLMRSVLDKITGSDEGSFRKISEQVPLIDP